MTDRDSITAMLEAAKELKFLHSEEIVIIPELQGIVTQATDLFHDIAVNSMKSAMHNQSPEEGIAAMQRICMYLFVKGVEAVMLWSLTPDGKGEIGFDPQDLVNLEIQTALPPEWHKIAEETQVMGLQLFNAHNYFIQEAVRNGEINTEQHIQVEMKKAIRWSMTIGIMYAIEQEYHAGVNGEVDSQDEIFNTIQQSAENGNPDAQYHVGLLHAQNEDYEGALSWWQLAAHQGHVEACCNLGSMYFKGDGVQEDYPTAATWYMKAAELGDAKAQALLSRMYFNGWGVKKDLIKAYMWSYLAIEEEPNAELIRDSAAKDMTKKQMGKARKQAGKWRKRNH